MKTSRLNHLFRLLRTGALVALMLGLASLSSWAQIAKWNLTSTTTSATTVDANLTASAIGVSSGSISYQTSPGDIYVTTWSTSSSFSTSGKYWELKITPKPGYQVAVTGFALDQGRTATGPSLTTVQYSLDAFNTAGTTIVDGAANANTSSLTTLNAPAVSIAATTSAITFRIWGYGASSTGNFRLNNVVISGTVSSAVTAPTVTVSAATGVGTSTATLNGNVTSGGSSTVLERGFCYKTSSGVAITDNKTAVAGTTGAYTLGISSLNANVQYYYLAYATNAVGLALSAETNFWTLANTPVAPLVGNPTPSTLTVGIGSADGNPAGTLYAIHVQSPDRYVQVDGTLNTTPAWQTAASWGSQIVSGLSSSTSYTFEVKAQNGAGTNTIFGVSTLGTTATGVTPPAVTTQTATAITTGGAILNGTVTANGGAAVIDRGFYWSSSPGVTTFDAQLSEGGTTVAPFSSALGSLSANTVYYYRTYAANSAGTTLDSAEISFYTLANVPNAPTVDAATGTSLNVTIDWSDGNPANTVYAIQETTTLHYVQANGTLGITPVYQTAADWGTKTVTGLDGVTTYTFQVQAQNGDGINTVFGPTASESTILAPVVLAGWDVSGQSGYGISPLSASQSSANVTVGGLTRGSGVSTSGTAAGRAWGGVDWQSTDAASAIAANKFFTFTITPNVGKSVSFTSISKLDYRRSGTGASSGVLQCSTNGTDFTDITTLDYSVSTSSGASLGPIDLTGIPELQDIPAGEAVTFRIASFGGTSTAGTCYIFDVANSPANDLEIEGYVSTAGTSPAIAVSGNLAFGNVTTGTVATATMTITNPGTATLNVSGIDYPAGFSGAFSGAISAGGSQDVTVSFAPDAIQSYGGTITVNSDAASGSGTIASSGAGIAAVPPTIPVITKIQVSGGNVLIDFTGGESDATTDFSVVGAVSVTATFAPVAATVTTSGPGQFRATVAYSTSTPASFFRIKH